MKCVNFHSNIKPTFKHYLIQIKRKHKQHQHQSTPIPINTNQLAQEMVDTIQPTTPSPKPYFNTKTNKSINQSLFLWCTKKIDIKQGKTERAIFGSTQSFQNKIYDIFFKKKENYACTFCFCLVINFVWKEENKAVTKKKRIWIFFMAERGSETSCYERVDSFGNLILAICKSWQIEVEAELLEYA